MKGFYKNKDKRKYKYDDMLTYIFFIFNYLIVFGKKYNKLILRSIL